MDSPQIKRSLFILNPNAGIMPVKLILSKDLLRRKNDLSCYKSLSIDESGTYIRQAFDKYDFFIAAGGDGTVRSVAKQLVGTDKILGVLPMGSGNGFAREFGFRPVIPFLLSDIKRAGYIPTDVIELNDHTCLNVAGVGLDSFVAHSFDKSRTRGFWLYAWMTLKNFAGLKPFRVAIQIGSDELIEEEVFDLIIANTRQFGYNAFIAPEAKPNDGVIDIVILKPFPKFLAPFIIWRLFRGTLNKSKYVKYLKSEEPFTIRTDEKRFHIDGEPFTIEGKVNVSIRRNALSVLRTKRNKI
ncbi:MAG TPA: diacylglycerol kinase family protein [Bacteroidales bacterium]|nr:diacylglycerol kinase family protein [Bacteroidales bacterium]